MRHGTGRHGIPRHYIRRIAMTASTYRKPGRRVDSTARARRVKKMGRKVVAELLSTPREQPDRQSNKSSCRTSLVYSLHQRPICSSSPFARRSIRIRTLCYVIVVAHTQTASYAMATSSAGTQQTGRIGGGWNTGMTRTRGRAMRLLINARVKFSCKGNFQIIGTVTCD
ncbi:uncharacterized protein M421DRAFT_199970 [Didymella exigua CBS 183.55]|uniref:Uncharacterized protein n=1 Tax=Didymella exigua CBS 183.55 TaxID=1150837 RepID=A0A6A5S7S1_9PLEO|nr:uncharacterized protein M421DRAFT_199970 [Didymella exigua CBS 183.55]KAF1933557.1 hypothetical protein M421DRAFT_199970 [Didymella exigua CBS 183.55]